MANDSFNSAYKSIEKRRLAATAALFRRQDEIYKKIPQIQQLGDEITKTGAEYTLAVLAKDASLSAYLKEKLNRIAQERKQLLTSNGFAENALEMQYSCDKCKDTGYVNGKVCSCMKQEIIRCRQQLLSALSPAPQTDFEQFSLDYYPKEAISAPSGKIIIPYKQMQQVFQYCKAYAESFSPKSKSLIMLGSAGLGKTHLACAIANDCIKKGFTVMYASSQQLFTQIEQARFTDEDIIGDIISCDLFILDDLGAENITAYSNSVFYNIVNTRMINSSPCIYTTNLVSQQAMQKRYGEKITSRLMGSCERLPFVGEDIRILKRRQ